MHQETHPPRQDRQARRRLGRLGTKALKLAVLMAMVSAAAAQQSTKTAAIPLEQAVQDALAHDPTIELAKLELQAAQIDYQRSQATNLLSGTNASKLKTRSDLQKAELTHLQDTDEAIITLIDQAFALQEASLDLHAAQDELTGKQRTLQQVVNQEEAGAAQKLDVLSARADVNAAQADLTQAQDTQQQAQRQLSQSLGVQTNAPTSITSLPVFQAYSAPKDALARAQAASPDIVQQQAGAELAQLDLDKANAAAEAPLDIQKAQNALAIAKAQLTQAQDQLAVTLAGDIAAINHAADGYHAATVSLQLAQQRHTIVQQQRQAGLKTGLDVLNDTVSLEQSQALQVTALRTYENAVLTLEALLGTDLRSQTSSTNP